MQGAAEVCSWVDYNYGKAETAFGICLFATWNQYCSLKNTSFQLDISHFACRSQEQNDV
jgi:hypothetical protein